MATTTRARECERGLLELDSRRPDGTTFHAFVDVGRNGAESERTSAVGQRHLFTDFEHECFHSRLTAALLEASVAASHLADTTEVSRRALNALAGLTGASRGFLGRWDPGDRRLDVLARVDLAGDAGEDLWVETTTAWGWALETGRVVIADRASTDPRVAGWETGGASTFLAVPVRAGDEILGVIALADARGGFSEEGRQAAEQFGLALADGLRAEAAAIRVRELEEEVRNLRGRVGQAERFEGLGVLFGGLAHDFNNLLTVITGYGELLQNGLGTSHSLTVEAGEILRAAKSAGELTRWLLAFRRHHTPSPHRMDLHEVLRSSCALLDRLLGEDIRVEVRADADASSINADPIQIEQLVFSLAVRARGAMPDGGVLTVKTESRASGCNGAGHVLLLSVTDTGARGRALTDRLPFLEQEGREASCRAVAERIVEDCGGDMVVVEALNRGTTCRIRLPVAMQVGDRESSITFDGAAPVGTEGILVVEDEAGVRDFVVEVLSDAGYEVHAAGSGLEALETADGLESAPDLLISDMVLPDIGGAELRDLLSDGRPSMRVLFMSGYSEGGARGLASVGADDVLLSKPFTCNTLLEHVRSILDHERGEVRCTAS